MVLSGCSVSESVGVGAPTSPLVKGGARTEADGVATASATPTIRTNPSSSPSISSSGSPSRPVSDSPKPTVRGLSATPLPSVTDMWVQPTASLLLSPPPVRSTASRGSGASPSSSPPPSAATTVSGWVRSAVAALLKARAVAQAPGAEDVCDRSSLSGIPNLLSESIVILDPSGALSGPVQTPERGSMSGVLGYLRQARENLQRATEAPARMALARVEEANAKIRREYATCIRNRDRR